MASTTESLSQLVHHVEPLKYDLRFTTNPLVARKDTVGSHSWRSSLPTIFLDEIIEAPMDRLRVLEMLIAHDLTELDKGGTAALGFRDEAGKVQSDQSDDLSRFSYLPTPLFTKLQALWSEFKAQVTLESKIAKALERLESNWTAIESVAAVQDPVHCQKTIDYITGFLGIDPGLDKLIRQQLLEIDMISKTKI